jgi:hypothetical protein
MDWIQLAKHTGFSEYSDESSVRKSNATSSPAKQRLSFQG